MTNAIFGCEVVREMLIHEDHYEQYLRDKENFLTFSPGFARVFTRDKFLAIWSLLHGVNEIDLELDKSDIYKSRPMSSHLLGKIQVDLFAEKQFIT